MSPFRSAYRITQAFGKAATEKLQKYYESYGLSGHEGVDMVPTGPELDVLSVSEGVVIVDDDAEASKAYGNHVRVRTPFGRVWVYCHLAENCVELGQQLMRGDKIGTMGNTGTGTGAHLHLMTYIEGSNRIRLFVNNGFKGCENPLPVLDRA